ncbi:hypothetical protein SAMN05421493_10258 [Pseudobutyrivibrio sp. 49]|uniref:hypothetical protein n=1 Tax=Pseudobutyrivibrio sp. 49 TaxID=1855344 RepID=UPI0008903FD5|nr:hypothetical protein [Pseudobutyrivibrio sp. 49]SDH58935.1 hypothetical protein SAMN05421493_10258 [Pseudobutyrivibrio sp. 49]
MKRDICLILSIMMDHEPHSIHELAEKTRCSEFDVMKVFHGGTINYLFDLISTPLGKGIEASCYYRLNKRGIFRTYR